jgi:hypothetical protein
MPEVPWPAGLVDATLTWEWDRPGPEWDGIGLLWFLSPEAEGWHARSRCVIHVSRTIGDGGGKVGRQNVWQVAENGDGTVTVSPSVHFPDHFHSPRPVRFRLVDHLADRDD